MRSTDLGLLVTAAAVSLIPVTEAVARAVPSWPYEKLFKEADVVVIGRAEATRAIKDTFGEHSWPLEIVGQETPIRVTHSLKGEPGKDPVRVVHFKFGDPKKGERPGAAIHGPPQFVAFRTKELTLDVVGRERTRVVVAPPEYLLFLRRLPDGRYEPVSGQTDAAMSVREVGRPNDDLADK